MAENFMEYLHKNKEGPGEDAGYQQMAENAGAIEHPDPEVEESTLVLEDIPQELLDLIQQVYSEYEGDEDPSDEQILERVRQLLADLPDSENADLAASLEGAGEEPPAEEPPVEEPPAEEEPSGEDAPKGNALAKRVAELGRF